MRCLIVDDNFESRYLLQSLLSRRGHQIVVAGNGLEALALVRQQPVDVVISDILMPQMDGFQLCRELKGDEKLRSIPIILCTAAYTDKKDEEFALKVGAVRFLVKPVDPVEILHAVQIVGEQGDNGSDAYRDVDASSRTDFLKEYSERLINKLETQMREMEALNKRLTESETRYRELIENANDAILIIRPDGGVSFVNPKFCEMSGYTFSETQQLHIKQLLDLNDQAIFMRQMEAMLRGEFATAVSSFRLITSDHRIVDIDCHSSLFRRIGEVLGVQAILRDVTERKRSEDQLLLLRAQLRKLSTRVDNLIEADRKRIAVEIHDLLGGNLIHLRQDLDILRHKLQEEGCAISISEAVSMVESLISGMVDLLGIVRRISGELYAAELDLLGLVPALSSEVKRFEQRTGIHFDIRFHSSESQLSKEKARAVFRIFQEVLRNVQQHARATLVVVVMLEDETQFILRVADNGRGITKEEQNSVKSLGIFGMQERALRVGGRLTVNGEEGEGTKVTIVIPLASENSRRGMALVN